MPVTTSNGSIAEYISGGIVVYAETAASGGHDLVSYSALTDTQTVLTGVTAAGLHSEPSQLLKVGGYVYFSAQGESGRELWRTDGTVSNTVQVANINPLGSSDPSQLVSNGPVLYFVATDADSKGIWFLDTAGDGVPHLLLERGEIEHLTIDAGVLTFVSRDSSSSVIESFDLSTAAHRLLPLPAGVLVQSDVLVHDNGYYFAGYTQAHGAQLWSVDQAASAAQAVDGISMVSQPVSAASGALFFAAGNGNQLFTMAPGASAPVLVADPASGGASAITDLVVSGSSVYFVANDGVSGRQLWVSDGTAAGTRIVTTLAFNGGDANPHILAVQNGQVYFSATTETDGREVWITNGTAAGTHVIDLSPGSDVGADNRATNFTALPDGTVVFLGNDSAHGTEVWALSADLGSASILSDAIEGFAGSRPVLIGQSNGKLFYTADDAHNISRLWVTDGTSAGTHSILSNAIALTKTASGAGIGDVFYFSADDGVNGAELWRSDGTDAGTYMVSDLWPGLNASYPSAITAVGDLLYFVAADPVSGRELRVLNTAEATLTPVMVSDVWAGLPGSSPSILGQLNGLLIFTANAETTTGDEIYVTDGTPAGTKLLRDIATGQANSFISEGVAAGSRFYFGARDGGGKYGLWVTDGTSAGTKLVQASFDGATLGDNIRELTAVNDKVYFTVDLAKGGSGLWVSDGTSAGTKLVTDINSQSPISTIHDLVEKDGILYFTADDGVHGYELWSSDGTNAGTHLVADINPGAGNANIHSLSVVGSNLVFQADNGTDGAEVWVSDGTSAGTVQVTHTAVLASSTPVTIIHGVAEGQLPAAATVPQESELFGAGTVGGSGGRIIHVTSLAASGPGSLQEALLADGPRTIVFDVAGRINLIEDSSLIIKNPYVTIDGSTAPYPGITISGGTLGINTHDVIVRGLAIRPGNLDADGNIASGVSLDNRDGIGIYSDAYNILIEHNSVSWATDELIQIWGTNDHDITIRNNILSEGLYQAGHPDGVHSDALIVGFDAKNVAIYQNIFSDNARRNPVLQNGAEAFIANNLTFYSTVNVHFLSEGPSRYNYSGEATLATIVNNVILNGGSDTQASLLKVEAVLVNGSQVYTNGNIIPADIDYLSSRTGVSIPANFLATQAPVTIADYQLLSSDQVISALLKSGAVGSYQYDAIDQRILEQIKTGIGAYVNSATEAGGYLEDDTVSLLQGVASVNLYNPLLANDLYYQGGEIQRINTTGTKGTVTFDAATRTLIYTPSNTISIDSHASYTDTFKYFVLKDGAVLPVTVTVKVLGGDYVGISTTTGNDTIEYYDGELTKLIDGKDGQDVLTMHVDTILARGETGHVSFDLADDNTEDAWALNVEKLGFIGRDITLSGDFVGAGLLSGSAIFVKLLPGATLADGRGITSNNGINVTGGAGADTIRGSNNADVLDGGGGADLMAGGLGDDTYVVDSASDTVQENSASGTDTVRTSLSSYTLGSNIENLTFVGNSNVEGNGNSLANTIVGGNGNDILDGKGGVDTTQGGLGNDIYIVDNKLDVVIEELNGGLDEVRSTASYALSQNVENLVLLGTGNLNGTGNDLANIIKGNVGINILDGGAGADTMDGGDGNDTYVVDNTGDIIIESGTGGVDTVRTTLNGYTLGANVENVIYIGSGNFSGTGNTGANILTGGAGNDILDGGLGIDTLSGGLGDDQYIVDNVGDVLIEVASAGTDTVITGLTSYTLATNFENLTFIGYAAFTGNGNASANTLRSGAGNDTLDGKAGADRMIGGAGDDYYYVDNTADEVVEFANEGTDTVRSTVTYALSNNVENLLLANSTAINGTGNNVGNMLTGNGGANILSGLGGNDTIDGGGGADTMQGGTGDDLYFVDNLGDIVAEDANEGYDSVRSAVNFTLGNNVENLTLTGTTAIAATGNSLGNIIIGNAAANVISGGAGNDVLDGGTGADKLIGGTGDDTYVIDDLGDKITEDANAGTDTIQSQISYTLGANLENLTLLGSWAIDGTGNGLNNVIIGNIAANRLDGLSGDDYLDGGAGSDTMIGGIGNDTYVVDNAADTVVEDANAGTDIVRTSISYVLGANLEGLVLFGTAGISGTGNDTSNTIVGNSGDNLIDGGLDADTMAGETGNDTYVVDNVGDIVTENANGGSDTVRSTFSYTLGPNVENLVLLGAAGLKATGNELANILTGNSGDNLIDGMAGTDTMIGGLGDDTYVVDTSLDVVIEESGGGQDTVRATASFSLGANIENLLLQGTGNIDGTGNALANVITGNDGDNVLDGLGGTDTMIGGLGNDTYAIDEIGDMIVENAGAGTDTVRSTLSYALGDNLENLVLLGSANIDATGNSDANVIIGNSGDNLIDGGIGSDSMAGGLGNDTYVVDNAYDIVTEDINGGTDTVRSWLGGTLGSNLENLVLLGSGHINGTGNSLANLLTGNSGDNLLDGLGGADTMSGGLGNDIYVVDNVGDVVIEDANGGIDTVQAALSFVLGANVENLQLLDTGNIDGTGNDLANSITGNAGNNILDGMGGVDTMAGGLGNDIYVVDNAGDILIEYANGGTDTVRSSISYLLGNNFENIVLLGSENLNAFGNDAANVLTGNSGDNLIDGGLGSDIMMGGVGNDTFIVDTLGDLVIENAGAGMDTVRSSVAYALGANVENLLLTGTANLDGTGNMLNNTLVGNDGNNLLDGGAGNDILDGGFGADILIGGTGDDTFFINDPLDKVIENNNGGVDTVQTSLDQYTIAANVENLTYLGSSVFTAVGNSLSNIITGGSGDDVIDGKGGSDILRGGLGNDVYVVDSVSDLVFESFGEGADLVRSSVSYELSKNVENLTLFNSNAINGTGNDLNNTLRGNAAANVLDGRGGVDVLYGGAGNDTFYFRKGEVNGDTVADFTGAGAAVGDQLVFSGFGAGSINKVGVSDYLITPDADHGGAAAAELIHLTGVTNLDMVLGSGHNDVMFV